MSEPTRAMIKPQEVSAIDAKLGRQMELLSATIHSHVVEFNALMAVYAVARQYALYVENSLNVGVPDNNTEKRMLVLLRYEVHAAERILNP